MTDIENVTYDAEAEKAVIGAAMISKKAHDALLSLELSDFHIPAHAAIYTVIRDMIVKESPVDPITVRAELESRSKMHMLRSLGGVAYLHLMSEHAMPFSAPHYAQTIRNATIVRALHYAGRDLMEGTSDPNTTEFLAEIQAKHRARLEEIPGPLNADDGDDHDTVKAIMSEQEKPTDWITPGWLAREDRVVLVAGEGIAKTTMLRQFAVSIAGGLNPWNGQRVADGQRVLFIDAENSRNQSRRAYQWISRQIVRPVIAPGWKERIVHKTRNDGVDLPGRDFKWFVDVASRVSPDVLILGPAYKLMRGDPQKDRDVQDLLDVIDKVRVTQNCAVLVETHAPHGAVGARHMRPYGSSVWLRWPEIGIGYQRDMDERVEQKKRPEELEAIDWRGQREDRDWPDHIRYGKTEKREMPWVPNIGDWEPAIRSHYQIPEGEAA